MAIGGRNAGKNADSIADGEPCDAGTSALHRTRSLTADHRWQVWPGGMMAVSEKYIGAIQADSINSYLKFPRPRLTYLHILHPQHIGASHFMEPDYACHPLSHRSCSGAERRPSGADRKSTRLNSSH